MSDRAVMVPVFSSSASSLLSLQQVTCFLSAGDVKEELRETFCIPVSLQSLKKENFLWKKSSRSFDPYFFMFFRSKRTLSPRSWLWPSSSPAAALKVTLYGSPKSSRCLLSCPCEVSASVSSSKVRPYYGMMEPRNSGSFSLAPYSSVGDFDIPSSREDVDRDSPWNQWLRSEIPQLFLQAMEVGR